MHQVQEARNKLLVMGLASLVLSACVQTMLVTPAIPTSEPSPSVLITASPTLPQAPTREQAQISPTAVLTPIPEIGDVPASVDFLVPLVVRHVTAESATLYFRLREARPAILVCWRSGEDPLSGSWVELPGTEAAHQTTVERLEPGTEYLVTVAVAEGEAYLPPFFLGKAWAPVRFRTAALDPFPLRVGVVGDSGFGETITAEMAQAMAGEDLDFVLHTGDLVYKVGENSDPSEAFALKLYTPFAPVFRAMPFYPVPGNHDLTPDTYWNGSPFYFTAFPPLEDSTLPSWEGPSGESWYAFSYGDIQFLMLNSQAFYGVGDRSAQDAWLAERLADQRFDVSIPVCHVPPYNSGLHTDGDPVRAAWVPLFDPLRVPLVLSGHDHNYQRTIMAGITYLVSGGGSSSLYPAGLRLPETVAFAEETHFVVLQIEASQTQITSISAAGHILDEAVVLLPRGP